MKNTLRYWSGLLLVILGMGWLAYAEVLWWGTPRALASEAPYRFIKNRADVKQEHFDLSFGLAREITDKNVHPFLAFFPIVLGTQWFVKYKRAPQPGAEV